MSVSELDVHGSSSGGGGAYEASADQPATSPFLPASLFPTATGEAAEAASPAGQALLSPFSDSLAADVEADQQAAEALLAELEDEEFDQALQALADEAAGRQQRSVGTWYQASEAPTLGAADSERWLESVAGEAERLLAELEAHFADRPATSLRDGEMEAVAGLGEWEGLGLTSPVDAQEQFFKSLLNKAKKVVKGVVKVAKTGLAAVGSVLPMGRIFGLLRKLVRPLLRRVLDKAIGRLPAPLRPLATRLATRFTGEAEPQADGASSLAEDFDRQVTELVLAPNEAVVEQLLAEAEWQPGNGHPEPLRELDVARARLARELAQATPEQPPTAQLERFVPAVMGAMPLIRLGIRVVGRQRVVNFLAGALAKLIQGMVGPQAAGLLSRHIASTGLQLLGLEAESGGEPTLGTEALVAAAEDTVRQVMSLPPESLEDELLLESEIQDAFAEAAVRHLPAAVLRPELVEGESEAERGFWVLMPRATRPCFRYKKYSRIVPVLITRPVARSVVMSGGETLESRLLDSGTAAWPVPGEMEIYELLDGAEPGHLAAFEAVDADDVAGTARELEELDETAATVLAGNPALAAGARRRSPGRRYYRLRVGGRGLRRRGRLALRLDLTAPRPVLVVHLRIGERDAHALASHLERRQLVQVLSTLRRVLDPAAQAAIGRRLERMLGRRGVPLGPEAARAVAQRLADAMLHAVSRQLPTAAATLARAARDPAPGATLTFGFTFPDKAAIAAAAPGSPTLTIRPGHRRD